jgi:hypothetical protein
MQGTFALSYLVQLAIARTLGFFRHWYVDGSRALLRRYRAASRALESSVASRAMLQLLFRPLYGDYSVVGRIIGPIFRLGRLLMGGVLHVLLAAAFAAAFVAWALLPPLTIAYAAGIFSL